MEQNAEKTFPADFSSKDIIHIARSPTDSYKSALKYSPPNGSSAGLNEAEEKMMEVFKQMESIETSEPTMKEMANLFEMLPKVKLH